MTEKSGDRLIVSGVSRHDLEFALGFIGIADYKVESLEDPTQLGTVTLTELKEYAEQSDVNPQLATRLIARVGHYHPELLTENGSLDLDRLSEVLENADKWFAGGKKTLEFAHAFMDSKRQILETE